MIPTLGPAVIFTAQPAVNFTTLLSRSSLDQGFIQKIEAAASPGRFPSTGDSEAEKTPEESPTGTEPPDSAHPPIEAIVNRYKKSRTTPAFLACMHDLRSHLGLKAIDRFPRADYMNVPELFDLLGSSSRAFDALADFARAWATNAGKRPHFGPKQVLLHACLPKIAVDASFCKKSEPEPGRGLKPYVVGAV